MTPSLFASTVAKVEAMAATWCHWDQVDNFFDGEGEKVPLAVVALPCTSKTEALCSSDGLPMTMQDAAGP